MKKRSLKAVILNWPSNMQGRLFALIAVCKGSSVATCVKTVNYNMRKLGEVCKEECDTLPKMCEEMIQYGAQVRFVLMRKL
jgi:predicted AAA+ superfamily ATPase